MSDIYLNKVRMFPQQTAFHKLLGVSRTLSNYSLSNKGIDYLIKTKLICGWFMVSVTDQGLTVSLSPL